MKLDIFEFIESSVDYINYKKNFISYVARECNGFFMSLFKDNDYFLNSNYRIKSDNSIKEKLLRQNYINTLNHPRQVLYKLNDIVGIRLECRFNSDEKMIFDKIKKEFKIRNDDIYFRTEQNNCIFLNLVDPQPQYQKNGFEIYKIDGKYIDGDEELLFELQIKSMVNVFWGEIDHRILYKNFNYMITEDFIRNIMYSIKNNLEMVDNQLNTIYDRLKNIEDSNEENTKTQLKSILSKQIHDIYIVKLKNETGLLIDLRLISNLIIDFLFSNLNITTENNFDNRIVEVFDTINQLKRKKMVFGENISLNSISFRNNINNKLGNTMLKMVNRDFRWNICMKMIFDISKDEDSIIFMDFVNYVVHTVSYRVDQGVRKISLNKKERHYLKYELLNIIFDFYCENLDINYFNIDAMRKLQENIEKFVEPVVISNSLMDFEIDNFRKIISMQYQYANRDIKE